MSATFPFLGKCTHEETATPTKTCCGYQQFLRILSATPSPDAGGRWLPETDMDRNLRTTLLALVMRSVCLLDAWAADDTEPSPTETPGSVARRSPMSAIEKRTKKRT